MAKELKISPEGLELANTYLTAGSIQEAAKSLHISVQKASELLGKAEVKRYIDAVYLDQGYRNRFKMGNLLDEIINSKLEEARESEMYSSKDLLDILALQHKMKIEELKLQQADVKQQTNILVNNTENNVFGAGNYGKLMETLLGGNITEAELV